MSTTIKAKGVIFSFIPQDVVTPTSKTESNSGSAAFMFNNVLNGKKGYLRFSANAQVSALGLHNPSGAGMFLAKALDGKNYGWAKFDFTNENSTSWYIGLAESGTITMDYVEDREYMPRANMISPIQTKDNEFVM